MKTKTIMVALLLGVLCAAGASNVRNGSLAARGPVPGTEEMIEKLKAHGWTCPDAKGWPQSWSGYGENVQFEWLPTGGQQRDPFCRLSGAGGFVAGYHALDLENRNYILTVWAKGQGTLQAGFMSFGLKDGNPEQLTAPLDAPQPLKVAVDSEAWIRYQHVMKKTARLWRVHVTIAALQGTIDFDEVDLEPAAPGRELMVAEAEPLYGRGELIENIEVIQADAVFQKKVEEFDAAVRAFRDKAKSLDPQLVQSLEKEITALTPYIKGANKKEILTTAFNDMVLLTHAFSNLAPDATKKSARMEIKPAISSTRNYKVGERAPRSDTVTVIEVKSNKVRYDENETAQAAYDMDYSARKARIAHRKTFGVKTTIYQTASLDGQMGFEVFRRHPEFALYDPNGQPAADPIYGAFPDPMQLASPIEIGPKRKVLKPYLERKLDTAWGRVLLNLASQNTIEYEIKAILAYRKELGFDGVYTDGNWGVDPNRLGLFGYDQGGQIALLAAALDGRVQATVVSNYFGSSEHAEWQPVDRLIFGQAHLFDDALLAGLIKPGSLCVEANPDGKWPRNADEKTEIERSTEGFTRQIDFKTAQGFARKSRAEFIASSAPCSDKTIRFLEKHFMPVRKGGTGVPACAHPSMETQAGTPVPPNKNKALGYPPKFLALAPFMPVGIFSVPKISVTRVTNILEKKNIRFTELENYFYRLLEKTKNHRHHRRKSSCCLYHPDEDMYHFGMLEKIDHADLAALRAPRPFAVEAGLQDGVFRIEWVRSEFRRVKEVYRNLGAPENAQLFEFDGPHEVNGEMTFPFLDRWLRPKSLTRSNDLAPSCGTIDPR